MVAGGAVTRLHCSLLAAICVVQATHAEAKDWLRDPAISPNGARLAFRAKGDIYTVPISGGQATLLHGTNAHETKPVWLSDSRTVVFAANTFGNYDIFKMSIENEEPPERLTWHGHDELPVGLSDSGATLLFQSPRLDLTKNRVIYPAPVDAARTSIFSLSLEKGLPQIVLDPASSEATMDDHRDRLFFSNKPGVENRFRKHDESAATWDIWVRDASGYRQLTTYGGHDSSPAWHAAGGYIYYLSERSGTTNVWRMPPTGDSDAEQVTFHERHPVRGLSIANDGVIAYSHHGELYAGSATFRRIPISVPVRPVSASETEPVPGEQEIEEAVDASAFGEGFVIQRGSAFIVNRSSTKTRKIFESDCINRSLSLSADQRALLSTCDYGDASAFLIAELPAGAASWLDETVELKIREFGRGTDIIYAAALSPDGRQAAFTTSKAIKLIGVGSSGSRQLLTRDIGYYNVEQTLAWHPAGGHIAIEWTNNRRSSSEIAVVRTRDGSVVNISRSGFNDSAPKWVNNGHVLTWISDREGFRNFEGAATSDLYALFLDPGMQQDYLNGHRILAKRSSVQQVDDWLDKIGSVTEPLREERVRLTTSSSKNAATFVSQDMTFLARLQENNEIWIKSLPGGEESLLARLPENNERLARHRPVVQEADNGRSVFVNDTGVTGWIDIGSRQVTRLELQADTAPTRISDEHRWIFERTVRSVAEGYYRPEYLERTQWKDYVDAYSEFVAEIGDSYDFAELMEELFGELNSSHTAFRYSSPKHAVSRGVLGVVFDSDYSGAGWKLAEILTGSPLRKAGAGVNAGDVVIAVDGVPIGAEDEPSRLLNGKAGAQVELSIRDNEGRIVRAEVTTVSLEEELDLFYNRWIDWQRQEVDRLSGGKVAHVHMRKMDEPAFRSVIEDVLGAYALKDGIVLDLRYNEGGWMHEPLLAFLSAPYAFHLRAFGTVYASEPVLRVDRPLVVLINASNFSNGSEIPQLIKSRTIARLIGEQVAGTGLGSYSLQIPYPGYQIQFAHDISLSPDGKYWENMPILPDVFIEKDRSAVAENRDVQLEGAVEELAKEMARAPTVHPPVWEARTQPSHDPL